MLASLVRPERRRAELFRSSQATAPEGTSSQRKWDSGEEQAMAAQAKKEYEGEARGEFASGHMHGLFLPEDDADPTRIWRGLLFAVLLAAPFWAALYFLLRWWSS